MTKIKTNFFRTLLIAAALICTAEISAQGLPALFGKERANNRDRSSDIPTTITAMSMDVDMGRNIATLRGDVLVDDQEMTIRCEKMLIFFEEKKKEKAETDKAEKTSDSSDMTGSKKPVRIEC